MATTTTELDALPEPTEPVFRLSVEQYHGMIRAGVITDDDRVELIEGVLVQKMSKNPPHRMVVRRLITLMDGLLPDGFHYLAQEPVTLADGQPEPDGLVVRGSADDYPDRHPFPAETPLVIEVADTTLRKDRGMKLRSYARAGIPEYWIVNLVDNVIEVYTRPGMKGRTPGYAEPAVRRAGDELRVPIEGDVVIAVSAILP
jgi:Uma2 family endonuclease